LILDDLFLIAEVRAVSGSNGFVLINSFSDFNERFFKLKSVIIEVFGSKKEFFVEKVTRKGENFAIKFEGIDSSDDAEMFLDKKIFIKKTDAVELSENTFFIHDVIGSQVFMNSKLIGNVEDVLVLPANDVFVIKDTEQKRILVPAVKDFVKSFDPVLKVLILMPDCDLLYNDEN
jgi:16S rRNA processing protein RimM